MLVKMRNAKWFRFAMMCVCMALFGSCLMLSASAVDTSDPTPVEAAQQVFSTMHESLNFTTILGVIAVALGAAVAVFLGWWAIRKVTRMIMNAFSKGKVSV